MIKLGELIEQCIEQTVDEVLSQRELPEVEYIIQNNKSLREDSVKLYKSVN